MLFLYGDGPCGRHMTEHPQTKRQAWATWLPVYFPVVLLLGVLALATHVRIGLGHWPTPMFENYRTPAYRVHEAAVFWIGWFTIFAAIPLWLLLICFRRFRMTLKMHLLQAGIYAAGWLVIAVYVSIDPGQFVYWFLD